MRAKMYSQRYENSNAAIHELRRLKKLRKGPMIITNLRKIIQWYKTTGILAWQPHQWRKMTSQQQIKEVSTAIVEHEMKNMKGTSSAQTISRNTQVPYSTTRKILHRMLQIYPYKTLLLRIDIRRLGHPIGFFINFLSTKESCFYLTVVNFME